MTVSPDVVILTRRELADIEQASFTRGVERGKFEAGMAGLKMLVARNCANWKDGRCESCGAQHQHFEVSGDYACPHFRRATP